MSSSSAKTDATKTTTTKSVTKVDGKVVDQSESTKVTKTSSDSAAKAKTTAEKSAPAAKSAAPAESGKAAAPAAAAKSEAKPAAAKPAEAKPAAAKPAEAKPADSPKSTPSKESSGASSTTTSSSSSSQHAASDAPRQSSTSSSSESGRLEHAKSEPDLGPAMQTKVKLGANESNPRLKRFYSVTDISGKVKSVDTVPLAYYSPLNRYYHSGLLRRPTHYTGYYWRDPAPYGWTGIEDFYHYRRRYRDPIYYGQNPYFYGSGLTTFPLANWYASLYRRHRLWEPHSNIPYYGSFYMPRINTYPSYLYRFSWY